jgi:hypothetical protein
MAFTSAWEVSVHRWVNADVDLGTWIGAVRHGVARSVVARTVGPPTITSSFDRGGPVVTGLFVFSGEPFMVW